MSEMSQLDSPSENIDNLIKKINDELYQQKINTQLLDSRFGNENTNLVELGLSITKIGSKEWTEMSILKKLVCLFERVVLRIIRVYTNYQDKVNRQLVERVDLLETCFRVRPYMQLPAFTSLDNSYRQSLGYTLVDNQTSDQFDYFGFEEIFRGSESLVKERQAVYVQFFAQSNLVLDIGCGRGEFLELLAEKNINAIGIDTNSQMISHCNKKGLTNIIQQDCNHFLGNIAENSIDGIFSAQFIEHLEFELFYEFLKLSRRKLMTNGIFIAETVNPHCIEAMKTFHVDLTHVKPLFPEVTLFLCRSAGFTRAEIFHPNGYGFSSKEYWLQGEYSVIAWK
jgi:2-polyprenyl-3-methyl-5-hydroxy-6-metoxy-1,4-benzoquinol methylase